MNIIGMAAALLVGGVIGMGLGLIIASRKVLQAQKQAKAYRDKYFGVNAELSGDAISTLYNQFIGEKR